MIRSLVFFLLVSFLAAGCGQHTGRSFTGEVPEAALTGIAFDAANRLATLYPPGHTSLYLHYPTDKGQKVVDLFGPLLERSLRARGFTIQPVSGSEPRVSWTVDGLGGTDPVVNWYLRLKVQDETGLRTFGRVYDAQGRAQGGFAEGQAE